MCGMLVQVSPVKDVCQCQEGEVHVLTGQPHFVVEQKLPHGLHCADNAAMGVNHTLGVTCKPWQHMGVSCCCLASYIQTSHQHGCSCTREDTHITHHHCSTQQMLSTDTSCTYDALSITRQARRVAAACYTACWIIMTTVCKCTVRLVLSSHHVSPCHPTYLLSLMCTYRAKQVGDTCSMA